MSSNVIPMPSCGNGSSQQPWSPAFPSGIPVLFQTTQPTAGTVPQSQLWWDNKMLRMFDGVAWNNIGPGA